jgi:predicted aspartyl protease
VRAQLLWVLIVWTAASMGGAAAPDAVPATPATRFVSTRAGEVVVPVAIGGRAGYRFLLDTGSSHTAVAARLAADLGARPVARTTMSAAGGTVDCLVVALPRIAIAGGAEVDGVTATALPGSAPALEAAGVDGVLGQDVLGRFAYTIDYHRSRIVWHPAGYVAPGVRLALVPGQDRWLVELPQAPDARGAQPAVRRFVPDSGADALVLFGEARARELGAEWRPAQATLGSLTGDRRVRLATVEGLRVGDVVLGPQLAAVVAATAATDDPDGLLPLHLFASVFVSARERLLVIQPR